MKHLIFLFALTLFVLGARAQSDSTYTTFSSQQVDGYAGSDTCTHEYFTVTTDVTDSVANKRIHVTSRQCVKCGKQSSTENIWVTYLKEENEE